LQVDEEDFLEMVKERLKLFSRKSNTVNESRRGPE